MFYAVAMFRTELNFVFYLFISPHTVTVTSVVQRILFLLFYHLVLVMFLWSYYQTVFTDIGRVPSRVSTEKSHDT